MKYFAAVVALLLLEFSSMSPVHAAELIVVSATDNLEQLESADVAKIFLGKVTQYPSGEEVEPLNQDPSNPVYAEFARVVLNKSPSQLRAYWAKRVFTGKGKPPRALSTSNELRILVASHKRYLSYLKKTDADNTVRWIIELKKNSVGS